MTPAEREAAALEAVQEVWPEAVYIRQTYRKGGSRPKPMLELRYDCGVMYNTIHETFCLHADLEWGTFTPDELRAVLRALDILNGKD